MESNHFKEKEIRNLKSSWTIPGLIAIVLFVVVLLMAKSCQGPFGKEANHTRVVEPH